MDVISAVWQFFQEQVLGMGWLNQLVGQGLQALGVDLASRWAAACTSFSMMSLKSPSYSAH